VPKPTDDAEKIWMKRGDLVRDRYKVPKPGDQCVTGKVRSVIGDSATVAWDDGSVTVRNVGVLELVKDK